MSGLTKISYKNVSGSAVPPYGFVQMTGAVTTNPAGKLIFQVDKPGVGTGPCFIDSGEGATSSGDGQYGTCFIAGEGAVWLKYTGNVGGPTDNWCVVGPVRGQFYANETGGGYIYAGKFDSTNGRILAIKSNRLLRGKTASTVSAGTEAVPSTFTVNVWKKTGSTFPYARSVTTDTLLLGLTAVNRSDNLTSSSSGKDCALMWDEEVLEWYALWIDC